MSAVPTARRPRAGAHRRRKRVNVHRADAVAGGHGLRPVLAALDPVRDGAPGLGGWRLSVFTEMTPPPQADGGGLANAIFGSLMMVGLATLLGTPIGILAGIYLAEYGQKTWLGHAVRFINDILLSAPSIVIGLFIYAVVVAPLKGFSGWPACWRWR
jgi:phosphate transport system permease protein